MRISSKHLVAEVLGFVHDEHRGFTGPITLQQPVVEPQQDLALGTRVAGNAEVRHHVIEELGHVHARVEDERGRHLLRPQPFQQFVDERGLASAHFAGEQHKTLAALDAVGKASQGLLGVPRQKQITRVGIDVERVGAQPKKIFVHCGLDLDRFFFLSSLSRLRMAIWVRSQIFACRFHFSPDTSTPTQGTCVSTGNSSTAITSRSVRTD